MNTPGRWALLITAAMIAHGLNLLDNYDVARFVHLRPLWLQRETDAAIVRVDHVTKVGGAFRVDPCGAALVEVVEWVLMRVIAPMKARQGCWAFVATRATYSTCGVAPASISRRVRRVGYREDRARAATAGCARPPAAGAPGSRRPS